ncbi:hypothetical protein FHS92_003326 [Sphingobium subterraneum]|uniref:Core-binding (CB) domain-containing protein n=1 Tax=Sphingobium subterraneum TaxID=627688 RepID=A0A841J5E2_9SPHN|nr:hypothetical protein [Sphingobium subterraneum]
MEAEAPNDENALIPAETGAIAPGSADDLSWAVVNMRAGERIVVNEALIAAYQAASSPHSIRALKSDLEAFDLWCRRHNRIALPASPETVADCLDDRAGKGSKPASLGRYKASIANIHQLRSERYDPRPAGEIAVAGDPPHGRRATGPGKAAAVQGAGAQRRRGRSQETQCALAAGGVFG